MNDIGSLTIPNSKDNFKWLGYTFCVDDNFKLKLTNKQILQKTVDCGKFIKDIFSYVEDNGARIFIYKVWMNPVIEFFMLREVMHTTDKLQSDDNLLNKFQHKAICNIFKLQTRAADRKLTRHIIEEPSVEVKVRRFCRSIASFSRIRKLIKDKRKEQEQTEDEYIGFKRKASGNNSSVEQRN